MNTLTTEQENQLPDSLFGLIINEEMGTTEIKRIREYPIPDKQHARNAKALANAAYNNGQFSIEQKKTIDAMANQILGGN